MPSLDVVVPTRHPERATRAVAKIAPVAESIIFVMRSEWGFTQAVENGWRAGNAELVLFLNDDCLIEPKALNLMASAMNDSRVGLVGPTLPYFMTKNHVGEDEAVNVGDAQCNRENARIDGELPAAVVVNALVGACLLARREVLEKIDGWDTDFKLYCSDLDLCLRAEKAGYLSVWMVAAEVPHETRMTIAEMPRELRYSMIEADQRLFLEKHPDQKLETTGYEPQAADLAANAMTTAQTVA